MSVFIAVLLGVAAIFALALAVHMAWESGVEAWPFIGFELLCAGSLVSLAVGCLEGAA